MSSIDPNDLRSNKDRSRQWRACASCSSCFTSASAPAIWLVTRITRNEAGQLKRRILNSNRRPRGGRMTEHTRMRMQQADMRRLLGWLSCCLSVCFCSVLAATNATTQQDRDSASSGSTVAGLGGRGRAWARVRSRWRSSGKWAIGRNQQGNIRSLV